MRIGLKTYVRSLIFAKQKPRPAMPRPCTLFPFSTLVWADLRTIQLRPLPLHEPQRTKATQAQYWMGWQQELGNHLPQDDVAALAWYEKSAAGGFWMGYDRLARAYRNGELGVAVDLQKADYYLLQKQKCK